MAYNRVNWQNSPSTNTPVNATSLNIMDAGIDENSKLLNGKLTVEDITLDKVEFKNKFNKETVVEDSIIDLDGSVVSGKSGWCASDFIPIKANTKYVYQGITNQGSEKYSAYYDSNKQFISYFRQETGSNKRITTPNVAQYVRFSMQNSDKENFQLELGEYSTEYEKYKNFNGAIPQQTTAPVNPIIDDLWIDTTDNSLKRYNGTSWENVGGTGNGGNEPIGKISAYAGTTAPQGYLLCDGSAISRTEYSELFSVIGTSYNLPTDDDDTKFRVPNIKGRTVVGLDSNDSDFDTLGNTLGEKKHTLTINEMPSHNHNLGVVTNGATDGIKNLVGGSDRTATANDIIDNKGGGQPHNIIQPSIVLNYIIKANATTTTQGQIIDSLDSDSTTNAPSVHAVNEALDDINTNISNLIKTQNVSINIGTLVGNGGELFDQTTNYTIQQGYKCLGVIGSSMTGNSYTTCIISRLKADDSKIYWAIRNIGSNNATNIKIDVTLLIIKTTD